MLASRSTSLSCGDLVPSNGTRCAASDFGGSYCVPMLRARLGVRARILAIALIPSLTLMTISVGAAGYLVQEGQHAKSFAQSLQSGITAEKNMIAAVQQERLQSVRNLAGMDPGAPLQSMSVARGNLDQALRTLASSVAQLNKTANDQMLSAIEAFNAVVHELPTIRGGIDAGTLSISDAYGFFNKLLDSVSRATLVIGRTAPDPGVASQVAELNRMIDAMEAVSRSTALATVALGPGLPPQLVAEYRNLVGFYRTEIPQLAGDLGGLEADKINAMVAAPAWQEVSTMESWLISPPAPAKSGATASPPIAVDDWRAAADQVSGHLLDVWDSQNRKAQEAAVDVSDSKARSSLIAGSGVAAIAILALLLSIWLANRLIGRLRRLRAETLELAERGVPEIMGRLSDGEDIDPETEAARLDFGNDEIGSVANAFNRAHTAAVAAAVTEARTQEGVRAVFLNIAHRSQIVAHRQLEILDEAERREENPALLETLFKLDHLATRERRNAENLLILGGGQPGRQWRRPVPLMELVRSAIGETLDYTRVRTGRMPQVSVVGSVVAGLIHLLAELVDNATSFSPPQSRVDVTGNLVGKGVVVEITDQGMGIPDDELERANEMLREPPVFGVATLSVDSRMGLFVVSQLGVRHGISVRLAESDYGGIRAIVLVPAALIVTEAPFADHLPDRFASSSPEPYLAGEISVVSAMESEATSTIQAPLRPFSDSPRSRTESKPIAHPTQLDWAVVQPITDEPRLTLEQQRLHSHADTRPALPRRSRQASLAPELAKQPYSDATLSEQSRSAEQARDLMSAIQNGTRQGRLATSDLGNTITPDELEGEGDFFQRR
ncbi:nitrate- and nitrite sensing domain-containing protein [Nocardia vinacea]|uniref:sensor histidine kinase n=1 Tax=Nocardia vinacea TaxID=96468 RepID=UPI00342C4FDE